MGILGTSYVIIVNLLAVGCNVVLIARHPQQLGLRLCCCAVYLISIAWHINKSRVNPKQRMQEYFRYRWVEWLILAAMFYAAAV